MRPGALPLAVALTIAGALPAAQRQILKPVGALPAHIAGSFREVTSCQQSSTGDYLVFDRRSHAVYSIAASGDAPPREIVAVGAEPGRVLLPYAFDVAPDGTFVIADAPFGAPRLQFFFETGTRVGGFSLPRTDAPLITLGGFVVNGVGTVEYTGRSIYMSQPEVGGLVTEYAPDGRAIRTFGDLRATGQEQNRDVHLALNTGRIVVTSKGGIYFVFLAGTPAFRKYDADGKLVFERYVQGVELDEHVRQQPSTWPRRTAAGVIPLVLPTVRAAESDPDGNLWISLAVPFTYVYDPNGEKIRTVQFSAAGVISPNWLYFGRGGRLLVTPGCYAFKY